MSFYVNYEGHWRLVHTEVGQGLARVVIEAEEPANQAQTEPQQEDEHVFAS